MGRPQRSPLPAPSEPTSSESLPPSDADLIAACRASDSRTAADAGVRKAAAAGTAGGAAAYAVLYERHAAAARILARQLMHGRAEAEDLVSEAFARMLAQLRRGGGPDGAFRPYLLTTVRRVAYDRFKAEGKVIVSAEMETFDPGVPYTDPAVADLERTMIVRAFASLPERWRAVLWHTEIEGARPAEVAVLLGLTANGVAALAYRAREGLRQAYLQMHLSGVMRSECRPVAGKLGAFVRGGLAKRETTAVAAHLEQCADCQAVYAELADVNLALRGAVAPVILGPAAVAYLAAASHHGGGAVAWIAGRLLWFRHAPKSQQTATAAGGAAAAAGIVALALALTASTTPIVHLASPPAPVRPAPVPVAPTRVPAPRPAPPRHTTPALALPPSLPPRSPRPPSPRPRPTHPPKPTAPIQLTTLINPVGALLPGGTGFVEFTVTNSGRTRTKQVTAAITLPPGVTYQDPPMAGGWTCAAAPGRGGSGGQFPPVEEISCQHGPLQPGAVAIGYLPVAIATGAAVGPGPSITAGGGGSTVTEHASIGVASGGLSARFAATGQDMVVTAGATICPWPAALTTTNPAATATLALPGQVLWAGLYWSWRNRSWRNRSWRGWSSPGSQSANETIDLRGPGDGYQPVTAADVGRVALPDGSLQSEAFANVTSLVAQDGAGRWSAAPQAPAGWRGWSGWQGSGGWATGGYRPAAADDGWALVVVTTDPQVAPGTQVMVLDGARVVGPPLTVPLGALPPGPDAVINTITWQRDGSNITSFAQNLTESPAVTFSTADAPYLVGVVSVTDPPGS